jgi:hypothetical protein
MSLNLLPVGLSKVLLAPFTPTYSVFVVAIVFDSDIAVEDEDATEQLSGGSIVRVTISRCSGSPAVDRTGYVTAV